MSKYTFVLRDLAGVSGGGMIATGIGMIHIPSGIIAAGVMLMAAALLTARMR